MSSVSSWNYCVICMSGFLKEAIEFYFIFTVLNLLGSHQREMEVVSFFTALA